jgi:hypothetical protein
MHDVPTKDGDSIRDGGVTCIRDDPTRTFTRALTTTQFFCRQLRNISSHGARIENLCLFSCRKFENPERVDRVLP